MSFTPRRFALSIADMTKDIDHGVVPPHSRIKPTEPLLKEALSATVVVCTYTEERWEYIVEALGSLENQDVRPLEIVMVVDYNPELLKRLEVTYPDFVVVPNEHGRGLSGARNTGIEHARGDIVVFIDDDAYTGVRSATAICSPATRVRRSLVWVVLSSLSGWTELRHGYQDNFYGSSAAVSTVSPRARRR